MTVSKHLCPCKAPLDWFDERKILEMGGAFNLHLRIKIVLNFILTWLDTVFHYAPPVKQTKQSNGMLLDVGWLGCQKKSMETFEIFGLHWNLVLFSRTHCEKTCLSLIMQQLFDIRYLSLL